MFKKFGTLRILFCIIIVGAGTLEEECITLFCDKIIRVSSFSTTFCAFKTTFCFEQNRSSFNKIFCKLWQIKLRSKANKATTTFRRESVYPVVACNYDERTLSR